MPKTITKEKKAYSPKGEVFSFYGGRVQIEKKPWGDGWRFIKLETGLGGMLSATACTKYLDKSRALIPWAVNLGIDHVVGHFVEKAKDGKLVSFSLEEVVAVAEQGRNKHEEKKVEGGTAGSIIHDYAHDFAKAVINGTALPKFDHLNEKIEVEARALNGIKAFLTWYNTNHVEFLQMEQVVYYNSLLAGDTRECDELIEFVGIMDLLARVNGRVEVVDYKSSKSVYSDQRYQVSGYFTAHNSNINNSKERKADLFAKGARIVNFSKDTGDLIEKYVPAEEVKKDFRAFVGLHMVATREKELDEEYRASLKASVAKE